MPRKIPTFQPRALVKTGSTGPAPHDHLPGRKSPFASDRRWRRVRLRKLALDPLCEDCLKEGRTELATQVHHRLKRKDDPSMESWLDIENLMSLCVSCHSVRTRQDE
jgi:5-methylcytosine-specific restriction endonuclease McrA